MRDTHWPIAALYLAAVALVAYKLATVYIVPLLTAVANTIGAA